MTKNNPPAANNEAAALLEKIYKKPVSQVMSKQHQQAHQDICAIASHATQLLNSVSGGHSILTHPTILAAKQHHRRLIDLSSALTKDAKMYRETLLQLHASYVNADASAIMAHDHFAFLIQAYQGYEAWLEGFQGIVLPQLGAISDLAEQISREEEIKQRGA